MAFASMHEGIFQCNGCGKTYSEYVNGCVEEHDQPRRVELVVPESIFDYSPQFGEEE